MQMRSPRTEFDVEPDFPNDRARDDGSDNALDDVAAREHYVDVGYVSFVLAVGLI